MTVLEAIQKSTDFLTKKGVDSPRLQAELLLAHLLKLPRMKLYLNFERLLSPVETDALRELVKRRSQHEPLQHITGSTSFCGLEIAVNRHVLVPRPETEILAELGWEWLGKHRTGNEEHPISNSDKSRAGIEHPTSNAEHAGPEAGAPSALDFGTGSGCIAIALAMKCPAARIMAVDVSAEALALAKENAVRNGVGERIEFVEGDGFAALMSEGRVTRVPDSNAEAKIGDSCNSSLRQFDLIISNPPYIPTAEIEMLQPEVRDFDPHGALDGGADGLDFYRRFAVEAAAQLKPGGKIMLEFGDGQAEAIRKVFENEKWIVEAMKADYSHRERILIARC